MTTDVVVVTEPSGSPTISVVPDENISSFSQEAAPKIDPPVKLRRSQRQINPPTHLKDYVIETISRPSPPSESSTPQPPSGTDHPLSNYV